MLRMRLYLTRPQVSLSVIQLHISLAPTSQRHLLYHMAYTTTRNVTIDVAFIGDGRIVEHPPGTFRGGVPDPELSSKFGLNVLPEVNDSEGGSAPVPGVGSFSGTLQLNVWGTAHDYRELARHLLAIAELDSTADPGFHQHYEELRSDDGHTRLHVILRKVLE